MLPVIRLMSSTLDESVSASRLLIAIFPPRSARRDIAIQAAGNLVAAYVVVMAACVVGVGGYTPTLRYNLLMGTLIAVFTLIALALARRVTNLTLSPIQASLDQHNLKLTRLGQYLLGTIRDLVFAFVMIILFLPAAKVYPVVVRSIAWLTGNAT